MGLNTGRWSGRHHAPLPPSTHTCNTLSHTHRGTCTPPSTAAGRGQVTGFKAGPPPPHKVPDRWATGAKHRPGPWGQHPLQAQSLLGGRWDLAQFSALPSWGISAAPSEDTHPGKVPSRQEGGACGKGSGRLTREGNKEMVPVSESA